MQNTTSTCFLWRETEWEQTGILEMANITLHTFNVHGANRTHGTEMTRFGQKRKLEIDIIFHGSKDKSKDRNSGNDRLGFWELPAAMYRGLAFWLCVNGCAYAFGSCSC